MPKILLLAPLYPERSPSQRFRFEQQLQHWRDNGYEVEYSWQITKAADKFFYKPGNYFKKAGVIFNGLWKRWQQTRKANQYDIVFVHREAHLLGTSWFERQFAKSNAKVIFDFDDAIWIENVSAGNKAMAWLKSPDKTGRIIGCVDLVSAGNAYLQAYAEQFNDQVIIIPTTIDTDVYLPKPEKTATSKVCIGWSGSKTTIQHFEHAIEPLKRIQEKYGDRVEFRVIGDENYQHEALGIQGLPWRKDTELDDLSYIDIGLMPLPDEDWTKGKCGLKGLQYMALEIPTIMSSRGVNKEIIDHGENGFLAETVDEWVDVMSQLIEDAELRQRMGKAGRQTVVERYSTESQKDRYLNAFNELLKPDGDPLSV